MTLIALAGLAGLALVDSTSFGTLVLPLMMLLAPRVRSRNLLLYLATIAVFYFGVGVLLLLGATAVLGAVGPLLATDAASGVQLALGLGLLALSFVIGPKAVARRRARRGLPPRPPGAWRQRALGADASAAALVGAALAAGLIEVASMLPYLAAVGIILAADPPLTTGLAVLAGYVLVMVAPALVLLAVRRAAGPRVEARLARIEAWLSLRTDSAAAWTVGIIGALLAYDAVDALALARLIP